MFPMCCNAMLNVASFCLSEKNNLALSRQLLFLVIVQLTKWDYTSSKLVLWVSHKWFCINYGIYCLQLLFKCSCVVGCQSFVMGVTSWELVKTC